MGAWGYGLFQSDNDFDTLDELGDGMGLTELQEEMQSTAKAAGKRDEETDRICLSIHGGGSHPDVVRKYLDSGVLASFIVAKEAEMLSIPDGSRDQVLNYMFRDPCYCYILLGACAMTLGCHLPESYVDMLRVVYTEGGLMPDAVKQMRKALFGPNGYKDGEPYDFESKGLIETMAADSDDGCTASGFKSMNVMSPGGIFNTGMGNSTNSVIMKDLRSKRHYPDACAECSGDHRPGGSALMQCSRCKDRKYCSSACQKKH